MISLYLFFGFLNDSRSDLDTERIWGSIKNPV